MQISLDKTIEEIQRVLGTNDPDLIATLLEVLRQEEEEEKEEEEDSRGIA